jgi:hypothetical protein
VLLGSAVVRQLRENESVNRREVAILRERKSTFNGYGGVMAHAITWGMDGRMVPLNAATFRKRPRSAKPGAFIVCGG